MAVAETSVRAAWPPACRSSMSRAGRTARQRCTGCLSADTARTTARCSTASSRSSTTKRRLAGLRLAQLPPWWATDLHQHKPPTRLSLAQLRADSLHRLLLTRRRDVRTLAAIYGCSELFSWPRRQIEQAVDTLIADGRLADDAHGRLIVRKAAP